MSPGWVLLGILVAALVLVLPGFGLAAVASGVGRRGPSRGSHRAAYAESTQAQPEPRAARLMVGLGASLCLVAGLGDLLAGLGLYSTSLLGLLLVPVALLGLVPFGRWVVRSPVVLGFAAVVAALAAPVSWSVFDGGAKPALSYQWFYWELGRQLNLAHGIPTHVMEWNQPVRWQPDYLHYNHITQAFLGLMPGADSDAVASFRVPLALLLLGVVVLVMRLWFGALGAFVGTTFLAATDFATDKLGNNTSEALGLTFGLVAVWLVVSGYRHRRVGWVVLGGGVLGVAVSVHGIGATVSAMVLVGGVLAEMVRTRPSARWFGILTASAALGALVVVVVGTNLQGRATPLSDARNPALRGGEDPTFQFLQFSNGHFTTPVVRNRLASILQAPLPFVRFESLTWVLVVTLVSVGVLAALVLLRRRALPRLVVLLVAGLLGTAAVLWFSFHYRTYIPRHTGNVRIAAYSALGYALLIALAVDGWRSLVSTVLTRRRRTHPQHRWAPLAAGAVVLAASWGLTAPHTLAEMSARPALSSGGVWALHTLQQTVRPGGVVVSNVATRGTFELFTGLEDPAEGRQPLIETGSTLQGAIDYLRTLHDFLEHPSPGVLEDKLGAGYLVIARPPRALGTSLFYGKPPAMFATKAGLQPVATKDGVTILKSSRELTVEPVTEHADHTLGTLLGGLVLALGGLLVGFGCRRLARR